MRNYQKHGYSRTRLYRVWCAMRSRCHNPHNKRYERYGGRGICLCPEWEESYVNFYQWAVENGYKEGLTIDRIDNDKGYSPENCRWATHKEQNRNQERNRLLTYNGKTQCAADWAKEYGVAKTTILRKIKKGIPADLIFKSLEVSPE